MSRAHIQLEWQPRPRLANASSPAGGGGGGGGDSSDHCSLAVLFSRCCCCKLEEEDDDEPQSLSTEPRRLTVCGRRVYKIVLLGSEAVGKTSLVLQFVSSCMSFKYVPTQEDNTFKIQKRIGKEVALLDVLDTTGKMGYGAARKGIMKYGEIFMIVYSVTDRGSFIKAVKYRMMVQYLLRQSSPLFVLIANKVDAGEHCMVKTEEGMVLAERWGCPFVETSAHHRIGIVHAFHAAVSAIRQREQEEDAS